MQIIAATRRLVSSSLSKSLRSDYPVQCLIGCNETRYPCSTSNKQMFPTYRSSGSVHSLQKHLSVDIRWKWMLYGGEVVGISHFQLFLNVGIVTSFFRLNPEMNGLFGSDCLTLTEFYGLPASIYDVCSFTLRQLCTGTMYGVVLLLPGTSSADLRVLLLRQGAEGCFYYCVITKYSFSRTECYFLSQNPLEFTQITARIKLRMKWKWYGGKVYE